MVGGGQWVVIVLVGGGWCLWVVIVGSGKPKVLLIHVNTTKVTSGLNMIVYVC